MVLVDPSTREARPGGRWSRPGLIETLLRLAALERATAHVIAGWVPKVPELDDKLALASGYEETMVRAATLRHHALALLERDETRLRVDPACIEPLQLLDTGVIAGAGSDLETVSRSALATAVASSVLGTVRPFLRERYRDLAASLDPMLDARLSTTVQQAVSALSSAVTAIGTVLPGYERNARLDAELERAWARARVEAVTSDSGSVHLDELLWSPFDRVSVPARPAGRRRPVTGSRAHFRKGSRLTIEDLAGELNDNVMAELCALELLCRCSYEHPAQPWSRHLAMARHATDEARHAAIFRRLLAAHRIDESSLPQHGVNYEYGYEYPECEPGSGRELVWRLLILCTVLEALAIDKLPVEIGGRDFVGQADFARALDYIACDELFHAENGLRLTRQLCDEFHLDPVLERELVHGRFFGAQRDVRLEYLEADPARAAAEIAILEAPDPDGVPYKSRTEVELRLRCSFTIDDCEQVERWGYNSIRHHLLGQLQQRL